MAGNNPSWQIPQKSQKRMCIEQPRSSSGPHNGWSHLLWQFSSSRRTFISRASS